MADKLKRPLVVLEDSTLAGMALNATITREFPFLTALARLRQKPAKKGCGRCGQNKAAQATVFNSAKLAIAGLDGTKKRRLKDLLNAKEARVTYREASGRVVQRTF